MVAAVQPIGSVIIGFYRPPAGRQDICDFDAAAQRYDASAAWIGATGARTRIMEGCALSARGPQMCVLLAAAIKPSTASMLTTDTTPASTSSCGDVADHLEVDKRVRYEVECGGFAYEFRDARFRQNNRHGVEKDRWCASELQVSLFRQNEIF